MICPLPPIVYVLAGGFFGLLGLAVVAGLMAEWFGRRPR